MSCRNCPDTKPRPIRIPNYGMEMMWFKAKEGFDGCEHDSSNGIRYKFYTNKPTKAPAEMQRNKYTLVVAEEEKEDVKEVIPSIIEDKEVKKGGK